MAKRFYLYERKRAGKSSAWYVRYRKEDGTIGSPIPTGKADEDEANELAIEHLSDDLSKKSGKSHALTFKEWAEPWWKFGNVPLHQREASRRLLHKPGLRRGAP
jgi:hypothetical protein